MSTGLGVVGGGVAYGIDWGTDKIPLGAIARTAVFGAAGLVTATAVAGLASEAAGAGIAGGTGFRLGQRIAEIWQMKALEEKKTANGEAGAVYGAPVSVLRDGGAVLGQAAAARTERAPRLEAPSLLREAGASFYVPGRVEKYGPHSWVYGYDEAGAVIEAVSAHNV